MSLQTETSNQNAAWLTADAPLVTYFPIIRYPSKGIAYIPEHDVPGYTFDAIVKEIFDGQYEDVHKVLLIDEIGGRVENVTAKICEALIDYALSHDKTIYPELVTFIECHVKGRVPASVQEAA